ncbi:CRAL-TRIO domain-containing protein [Cunninghamella echinulata]|nr:CRAL-TRIO domain-containing protein [Cunninghamella echinulata]
MLLIPAVNISLDNRQEGHTGALTTEETKKLKQLWTKVLVLFEQKGQPYKPVSETSSIASGKSTASGKSKSGDKDVFVGATTNPLWMSLPFDKAVPLIPGNLLKKAFWNMVVTDNPDATLLRYLRARKWDLNAAYEMLVNTLRWRLHMRVDEITALGQHGLRKELNELSPGLGDQYHKFVTSGISTLGGPDRDGRVICYVNVQMYYKANQSFEILKLLTVGVMEAARLFCGHPTNTYCIVFNMENFTLANMDYDFVKFLNTCLEQYYPECLALCLIHKAPWIFSTVWAVIKGWFDPVVVKKFQFTNNLDDFSKYIDLKNTPAIISGERDNLTKAEVTQVDDELSIGQANYEDKPDVVAYREEIDNYIKITKEWVATATPDEKESLNNDALVRLNYGLQYRLARVKAEKHLRAPTVYHLKGLVRLENDRLYIDFGDDDFKEQDITDRV